MNPTTPTKGNMTMSNARKIIPAAVAALALAVPATAAAETGTRCASGPHGAVYASTHNTSCPMALATTRAWLRADGNPRTLFVRSPVTGQTYRMTRTYLLNRSDEFEIIYQNRARNIAVLIRAF